MRLAWLALPLSLACLSADVPPGYRLAGAGAGFASSQDLPELKSRYPEFFAIVFDEDTSQEPDLRPLRADLERQPADAHNYDALNSIAIAYFAFNLRAEQTPTDGLYLGNSFRAAKLVAVPWRAYREVSEPALRDAILDFFSDAGSGDKPKSAGTAPRLARIVASLAAKEPDPVRRARIEAIARDLGSGARAP